MNIIGGWFEKFSVWPTTDVKLRKSGCLVGTWTVAGVTHISVKLS